MAPSDRSGNAETIARLESTVLTSVLLRQPLPGRTEPIWFPDLAWITDAPTVFVSDENLTEHFSISIPDLSIEVVNEADLRGLAADSGDMAFVRFDPPQLSAGLIRIVMELRIAPAERSIVPLGLGGIQVPFAESDDGEWTVIEAPVIYGI